MFNQCSTNCATTAHFLLPLIDNSKKDVYHKKAQKNRQMSIKVAQK